MRKLARISCGAVMVWLLAAPVAAGPILFEFGFNINGTVYTPSDVLPASLNTAGFDFNTGLGTLTFTTPSGPDAFHFLAVLDIEIDEESNTFFNEYGDALGTPVAGQSWEIDEPGYVFGDIYANFLANALDNTNGVPSGTPDDVSMALGWNVVLGANEFATLTFIANTIAPASGFYLVHTDPDSGQSVYFSSTATVVPTGVPEPGTLTLFGLGLLLGARRLRRR